LVRVARPGGRGRPDHRRREASDRELRVRASAEGPLGARRVRRFRQRVQRLVGRRPHGRGSRRPLAIAAGAGTARPRRPARRRGPKLPRAREPRPGSVSAARVKIVRALAVVAALCVLAAVAAAGGALWLLGTERGTAFAFARAAPHIESFVRIGGVEGTLAGRLVLRNVETAAGAERISIDRLGLEWPR